MKDYRNFAVKLAKKSGKIIKKNFVYGMEKERKEDGSPVTKTDLAINRLVIEEIKKEFPGHGIISEEEDEVQGEGEYSWVCDPVDGTIPFSHGMPLSCFSLALVKDGVPILGVTNNPFEKNIFVAEKGKGAFLNGKPIKVSQTDSLAGSIVYIGGWSKTPYQTSGVIDLFEERHCHAIMLKSIVYGGSLLAAGQIVAAVGPKNKPWDIAALKILVEEAGGKVTDFNGQEQRYDREINGALMSNGILHDELLEMIRNYIK